MTKDRKTRYATLTESHRRELGLSPNDVPTERRNHRPDPVWTWRIV